MARVRLSARTAVAVAVLAAASLGGCDSGGDGGRAGAPTTAAPRRGGSVRVGVWAAPDPAAPHVGGAAVRALALPQLFVADPDGSWRPSLVEPGSDETADDATSASFRLRRGATWSDGSPLTADDLRRTADAGWVAGVDGPDGTGTITVRFTRPFPGWRRLWSGVDSVAAPGPGVWGGPFVVSSTVPGLEAVLTRNDRWRGGPTAHLDEVRMVLVPDVTTARQLLGRGELDVVMPPAYLHRRAQFESTEGVAVRTGTTSGWWAGLLLAADGLEPERRRAVIASVDRSAFVRTLLDGEATVATGVGAAPDDPTWPAATGAGDVSGLRGATVDLVTMVEEPMTPLLHRSMQKRVRAVGGRYENRAAVHDLASAWLADRDYDAAIALVYDGPVPCWSCRWAHVDAALAAAADAGDRGAAVSLERRLRDEAHVLPLWRPIPLVAWRTAAVRGVVANGHALSGAWNAWEWSVP